MVKDDYIWRACRAWGYEAQFRLAQEECAELIVAINKLTRKHNGVGAMAVIEEMVDVELMLGQLKYMLDVTPEAFEQVKAEKIARLEKLLVAAGV